MSCYFNARHIIPEEELRWHLSECPDRHTVERLETGLEENNTAWVRGNVEVPTYFPDVPHDMVTEDWDAEAACQPRIGVPARELAGLGYHKSLVGWVVFIYLSGQRPIVRHQRSRLFTGLNHVMYCYILVWVMCWMQSLKLDCPGHCVWSWLHALKLYFNWYNDPDLGAWVTARDSSQTAWLSINRTTIRDSSECGWLKTRDSWLNDTWLATHYIGESLAGNSYLTRDSFCLMWWLLSCLGNSYWLVTLQQVSSNLLITPLVEIIRIGHFLRNFCNPRPYNSSLQSDALIMAKIIPFECRTVLAVISYTQ